MLTSLVKQSETLTQIVSLCKLKDHLGIINDNADDRLQEYLYAAQEMLADETGLTFLTTTWQELYDCFPKCYWQTLRNPVTAITSLKYYDTSNVLQTLTQSTDYWVTLPSNQAAILEPDQSIGYGWHPVYQYRPDAVQLVYTAGGTVPYLAQQFVKLVVTHWNDANRGSNDMDFPPGIDRILRLLRPGVYN